MPVPVPRVGAEEPAALAVRRAGAAERTPRTSRQSARSMRTEVVVDPGADAAAVRACAACRSSTAPIEAAHPDESFTARSSAVAVDGVQWVAVGRGGGARARRRRAVAALPCRRAAPAVPSRPRCRRRDIEPLTDSTGRRRRSGGARARAGRRASCTVATAWAAGHAAHSALVVRSQCCTELVGARVPPGRRSWRRSLVAVAHCWPRVDARRSSRCSIRRHRRARRSRDCATTAPSRC